MGRLLRVTRKSIAPRESSAFPFSIPAIRTLERLDFGEQVTFFVGENGSGKSTLLEAIACAAELPEIGGDEIDRDPSLSPQRALANDLRLAWSIRSRRGFFLRAEDFFGYLRRESRNEARIDREKLESLGIVREPSADDAVVHVDEREASKYLAERDVRSHGESFMDFFLSRIEPDGVYLLDEPEAPLSPSRQLSFLALLTKATRKGAQLVIATHSPILLAFPGARIVSFDASPIADVAYEDLEHVKVTRDFLNHPDAYLRHLR